MGLSAKVGTTTISTGAPGTTFDVTGLSGFDTSTKKAVIFGWSGRATSGFGEASHRFGSGFFTGTAARRAFTSQAEHAVGTTATDCAWYSDCPIATLTTAGVLEGKADVDSIITDGFRLIVDVQFTTALLLWYLAIWGSDLTEAAILDFTAPAVTGDVDYNPGFGLDTGLDDKLLYLCGGVSAGVGSVSTGTRLMFGLAAGDTPVNAVLLGQSLNAAGTTSTYGYCRTGECLAASFAGDQVTQRAASPASPSNAWLSTGFRLNWPETDAVNARYSALVLKGGRYLVGDILSQTGTSNVAETVGIAPKAMIFLSHNKAASSSDTTQPHEERSVGAASGATERAVAFIADQDAIGDSDIGVGLQNDAFYARIDVTNATKAVIGAADLVSLDANGFTFKNDDADPDQAHIVYAAIGEVPTAGVTYPMLERGTRGMTRGLAPMWR